MKISSLALRGRGSGASATSPRDRRAHSSHDTSVAHEHETRAARTPDIEEDAVEAAALNALVALSAREQSRPPLVDGEVRYAASRPAPVNGIAARRAEKSASCGRPAFAWRAAAAALPFSARAADQGERCSSHARRSASCPIRAAQAQVLYRNVKVG